MFLFIDFAAVCDTVHTYIQIHLMFLFIICHSVVCHHPSRIQIHLMFLFIGSPKILDNLLPIQIHLMFLFIAFHFWKKSLQFNYSNTSHVLIYRHVHPQKHPYNAIQIHLMFLFINIITAI